MFLKKINWTLLASPIILSIIGIISIKSTSPTIYTQQIFFLIISIVLVFSLIFIDIKILLNYSYIIFLFLLILTAGTIVFGITRNGAIAWYKIFQFTFQPSEMLKIGFLLALTRYFTQKTHYKLKDIIYSFIFFLLPVFITLYLQKDVGTGIVFGFCWIAITLTLFFTQSEQKKIISTLIVVGITLITSSLFCIAKGYQLERLQVFPDHLLLRMNHHSEIGYQVDQSLIAIGSSDFLGKGLSHGTQNQFGFLPASHNDFIFASIIEEMGLSSALIIFILYGVIIFQLYKTTRYCEDISIDIITSGIIGIFMYHIMQNIGMNIGIMPVTGVSLPFISYGGSFLITTYILIGIMQSVNIKYKKTIL